MSEDMRGYNIRVKQFNEQKALTELKSCPKIVIDYVKLIKGHWDNQKDLTSKAISQLKKYAAENQSKDQQIKDLSELLKKAHECIMYTHEHSKSPAYIFREYRKLYDSYQQNTLNLK